MAHYKVEIFYTSNRNKAAKLKVKNDAGKVILSSHIVLPETLHQHDDYDMYKLALHNFIPENYSPSNSFADMQKIIHFHQLFGKHYIGSEDNIGGFKIIKQEQFGKKIQGMDYYMTVSDSDFDVIKSILLEKNTVSFTCSKKFYLFGQKSCIRNSNSELNSYLTLGEAIKAEEERIQQESLKPPKDGFLKKVFKAVLGTANTKTSQSNYKNTETVINKRNSQSSNNSLGIFASFIQIADVFESSSPIASSHASTTSPISSCSSSSSSDCSSSPSFD